MTIPKMVTKFCSNTITFALDEEGYYNTNSVYNCILNDINQLYYLLGILNTKLITFWFNVGYMNIDNLFPHIQKNQLESIPIPNIKETTKEQIKRLVSSILIKRKKGFIGKTEEEHKLDYIVYKHYGLTYDEILIIDPATPITREEYEK